MGFTDRQVKALEAKLSAKHVRTREKEGKVLSYVEGWHAISEANRVFGFDAWDRETLETRCVWAYEIRGSHAGTHAQARVERLVELKTVDGTVIEAEEIWNVPGCWRR